MLENPPCVPPSSSMSCAPLIIRVPKTPTMVRTLTLYSKFGMSTARALLSRAPCAVPGRRQRERLSSRREGRGRVRAANPGGGADRRWPDVPRTAAAWAALGAAPHARLKATTDLRVRAPAFQGAAHGQHGQAAATATYHPWCMSAWP